LAIKRFANLKKWAAEKINEWKTIVDLPTDVFTLEPANIFSAIDDFIWSKLEESINTDLIQCYNLIYDRTTRSNQTAVQKIEADYGCRITPKFAGMGSIQFLIDFEDKFVHRDMCVINQKIFDLFPIGLLSRVSAQTKTISNKKLILEFGEERETS
jgi:hypothetical protein